MVSAGSIAAPVSFHIDSLLNLAASYLAGESSRLEWLRLLPPLVEVVRKLGAEGEPAVARARAEFLAASGPLIAEFQDTIVGAARYAFLRDLLQLLSRRLRGGVTHLTALLEVNGAGEPGAVLGEARFALAALGSVSSVLALAGPCFTAAEIDPISFVAPTLDNSGERAAIQAVIEVVRAKAGILDQQADSLP